MNELTFMRNINNKNHIKSDTLKSDNYQNCLDIDEADDFEPDYDRQAEMDEALIWGI